MAAIDLQRSLEHGGGHPRATDTFDSEMQEWEDQLHDMQRKIEELYNEVQARRGGSDVADDNGPKNGAGAEFGPGGRSGGGNAFFADRRGGGGGEGEGGGPGAATVPNHHNGNGCNRALSQKNGHGRCHDNEVSQIGDLLQDYLGQGKGMDRKNNSRTRRVHFDQTVRVSQDLPAYQDGMNRGPEIERMSQEHFPGGCEDAENRKNRAPHAKSHPGKESSPNKENTGANKPPLRQRDASAGPPPPRAQQLPNGPSSSDSPAPDRKSFAPGALVDRKCGSPSVLRKFGAMLQENEGKTLTDTGVVTTQQQAPQAPEPRGSTPSCQRRGLGAAAPAGKAPPAARVPTQKCQADSDAPTAAMEPGQERGLLIDSGRPAHAEQRPKGPHPPPPSQRRAQVAGSPKLRPRANSGADRDTGPSPLAERARRSAAAAAAAAEPRADYRNLSASYGCGGAQRMIQKAGGAPAAGQSGPPSCGRGRDDGLIELLDMLDIQHEYGSSSGPRGGGHTSHRQDAQQGSPGESSPSADRKCFSRPTRPANQRPPSRWAGGRTPATAPSGPMYRPPTPLARPPSPMTQQSPSPTRRQQQPPTSYCLHTETVIM